MKTEGICRRYGSHIRKLVLAVIYISTTAAFSSCYPMPREDPVLAPPLKEPPKVEYNMIDVKKGSIEKRISCIGSFVSANSTDFSFPYKGGYIKIINVKYGDMVKKGDILAELDTDNLESSIEKQKIILKKLKFSYEKAEATGESQYDLEQAALDIELEQINLNDLLRELDKSRIVSTVEGSASYINGDIRVGDYINSGVTLVTVVDSTEALFKYTGDKAYEFSLGMDVSINVERKLYKGTVVMTPYNVSADDAAKSKDSILVKAIDMPDNIKMGTNAEVILVQARKDNVIVIDRRIVNTFSGRKIVKVLVNGIATDRDVETGLETETEVEIVKGLEVGEKIICQ